MESITNAASAAAKSLGETAQWAGNKLSGETHEAQRKAAGEAVTSENTTIGQKVDGAKTWVTEGSKEAQDKAKAEHHNQKSELHKQDAKHS